MTESPTMDVADATTPALTWLGAEFPGWTFTVDRTSVRDTEHPLWVARRHGHHPQSALSAGKLHTRLTDYLDRQARRGGSLN